MLLALCAENSQVTGEFPSHRSVTRSFDVFFDLRLNKNDCVNSRHTSDLRYHCAHYEVNVIIWNFLCNLGPRSSSAMYWIYRTNMLLVFNEELFQLPAPYQCPEIIQNIQIHLMFPQNDSPHTIHNIQMHSCVFLQIIWYMIYSKYTNTLLCFLEKQFSTQYKQNA